MVQIKLKNKVTVLFLMISMIFALLVTSVTIDAQSAADTAYAAGTRTMDSITIADMYANKDSGKFGNYSWDPSKLKEITNSSFTIGASVAVGYQPFYICWKKPSGSASPSKVKYGYTPGDGVTKQSASKGMTNTLPTDIRARGGNYAVSESTLYGDDDELYFYISSDYMHEDIVVTSVTFQPMVNTVKVNVSAGAGVKSVYLSKNQNATSGSASGATFDKGDTVYAFAILAAGYKHQNNWTLVSGTADTENAVYMTKSYTLETSDYNFGAIDAAEMTKNLARSLNGGGNMSSVKLTYGQTVDLSVPERTGYTFVCWNTKANGSGTSYGSIDGASLTAEQVNAILLDDSVTTVYAQWSANKYTVTAPAAYENTTYYLSSDATATSGVESGEFDFDSQVYCFAIVAEGFCARNDWTMVEQGKYLVGSIKVGLSDNNFDDISTAPLNEAAAEVDALIDAIGEVEYNTESKGKIDEARAAYDALTDAQKAFVTKLEDLTAAENAYHDLEERAKAAAVDALIDAIGEVEYNAESKDKIDEAKAAYDALTDAQKAFVTKSEDLTAAENTYQDMEDKAKAAAVKALIAAIGEVTYPDSKQAITAARSAYDGLTDPQKRYVDNYSDLTDAEAAYAKAEEQANNKKVGGIVAGVITGCVALAGICFLVFFLLKKKKEKENSEQK